MTQIPHLLGLFGVDFFTHDKVIENHAFSPLGVMYDISFTIGELLFSDSCVVRVNYRNERQGGETYSVKVDDFFGKRFPVKCRTQSSFKFAHGNSQMCGIICIPKDEPHI